MNNPLKTDIGQLVYHYFPFIALPIALLRLEGLYLWALIAIAVGVFRMVTRPINAALNYKQTIQTYQSATPEDGSTVHLVLFMVASLPATLFMATGHFISTRRRSSASSTCRSLSRTCSSPPLAS